MESTPYMKRYIKNKEKDLNLIPLNLESMDDEELEDYYLYLKEPNRNRRIETNDF